MISKTDDWEAIFKIFVSDNMKIDAAHDIEHIKRVVFNAKEICIKEGGNPLIVTPAS
jgi:uncharacterized protein